MLPQILPACDRPLRHADGMVLGALDLYSVVELLRADLENLKLMRDYNTEWYFYGPHPTHP